MTRAVYKFLDKREESHAPVAAFVEYLRTIMAQVENIENIPDLFYVGDVRFKRKGRDDWEYIEIKAESRASTETPNFAVEEFSCAQQQRGGGPWQSSADYYAHIYSDGVIVIMRRWALIYWLELEGFRYRSFEARNPGYTGTGILVPRAAARKALKRWYCERRLDSANAK